MYDKVSVYVNHDGKDIGEIMAINLADFQLKALPRAHGFQLQFREFTSRSSHKYLFLSHLVFLALYLFF